MSAISYVGNEMTEKLAHEWEARGFEVLVAPQSFAGLEDVFHYYQPDIIATKGSEKYAIEVKSKGSRSSPDSDKKLGQVAALFERHPGWKFQVVYFGQAHDELPQIDLQQLTSELQAVEGMTFIDPRLALIKLWSLTEALVRHLYPSLTQRPQSPGRLVELLAGRGDILPSQAAQLRAFAAKRNKFVHGDLTVVVTAKEIGEMKLILSELLANLHAPTD